MPFTSSWRYSLLLLLTLGVGHRQEGRALAFTTTAAFGRPVTRSVVTQKQQQPHMPLAVAMEAPTEALEDIDFEALRGDDGVYNIETKEQHKAFLQANEDRLVILKVFAPWCRACKGLEPKFQKIANDPQFEDLPIVFSSMTIQNNKEYVKAIGVLALPTVQFYRHGKLQDNFPCGPSKVPIFKRKLAELVNQSIDKETRQVKPESEISPSVEGDEAVTLPAKTPAASAMDATPDVSEQSYLTEENMASLRNLVYFQDLSDQEFDEALRKAKILTFDQGALIMREGNPGRTFYYILDGEVEICQRTAFEDPLITPRDYVGTVVNQLGPADWFGERALITGEPRAASIRASLPLRCVAFQNQNLPPSCVLSSLATQTANDTMTATAAVSDKRSEMVDIVNEKYGLSMRELDQLEISKQIDESNLINQKRGSALNPKEIPGVDTDEDIDYDAEDVVPVPVATPEPTFLLSDLQQQKTVESIMPLLEKFKLIRLVSRCFDYIVTNKAQWGDPAIRRRRAMLVAKLPPLQRQEFTETFQLLDSDKDGGVSLLELKRVMESVGEEKSEEELMAMIPKGLQNGARGEDVMSQQDFMGIMAEAEFYYLFRDIFSSLDKYNSGFVKAGELDRVLCGVRDLISDDQHSIIDVEDKDMSIDYEQFTRMLLGLTL